MSYKCEIIVDSVSPQGCRLTTFKVTYPRIIHAEMLRHRMLSRNVASSRAIPFAKMVKDVEEHPFIPIAWQKNHPGMQGTEYLSKTDKFNLSQFVSVMIDTLNNMVDRDSKEFKKFKKEVKEKVDLVTGLLSKYTSFTMTLDEWWLLARDKTVEAASIVYVFGVTKQLCNRLLEPFVWTTELITGTEWENFFSLRCPRYNINGTEFRSKKDALYYKDSIDNTGKFTRPNDLEWLQMNKSQAEIHIQKIAEMMWDVYNESTPKQLQTGEWHIPFGNNIDEHDIFHNLNLGDPKYWGIVNFRNILETTKVKIATARCARLSYTTLGDEPKIDYEADIKLHDRLLAQNHMSPFEHCARVMTTNEYNSRLHIKRGQHGWCNNFKGFIQYRHLIE